MIKKILCVGCGGIASFLLEQLHRLILANQIDLDEYEIYVADDDVVETKNIRYQNFVADEVFKNKAEVIGDRYGFFPIKEKINSTTQIEDYDLIVVAVDNSATRKFIYEYCVSPHNKTYFIDLRSEGRNIAFFTKGISKDEYLKSLGNNISDSGGSCQLQHDLDNGIIQNGNVIVSAIGSQLVLNWVRGDYNPTKLIQRI